MLHDFSSIRTNLASVLHTGTEARLYHVCSQAAEVKSLFAPAPQNGTVNPWVERTSREDHLIFLTQGIQDEDRQIHEVAVVAVEIIVYTTASTTTIYVSKADTSGHKPSSDAELRSPIRAPSTGALLSKILESFVAEYLDISSQDTCKHARRSHQTRKVILCLCAKSQNQYLFPGSIENQSKHVLDDRALIKWWSRVFDKTMHAIDMITQTGSQLSTPTSHGRLVSKGYLMIPGGDRNEIRRHFLPNPRLISAGTDDLKWQHSYPVEELVHEYTTDIPLMCLIPRFPDDPKTRLWNDLKESDLSHPDGAWHTVANLDSFWNDYLAYRKESCAGRFVGFMWSIFTGVPKPSISNTDNADTSDPVVDTATNTTQASQEVSGPKRQDENELVSSSDVKAVYERKTEQHVLHEPIEDLRPSNSGMSDYGQLIIQDSCVTTAQDAKQNDADVSNAQSFNHHAVRDLESTHESFNPSSMNSRNIATVTPQNYESFIAYTQDTDFAGVSMAVSSTAGWIAKAKELSEVLEFGTLVVGISGDFVQVPHYGDLQNNGTDSRKTQIEQPAVTVLTGRRQKKRKAAADGSSGIEQDKRSRTG